MGDFNVDVNFPFDGGMFTVFRAQMNWPTYTMNVPDRPTQGQICLCVSR
jgi:hypothetical protein